MKFQYVAKVSPQYSKPASARSQPTLSNTVWTTASAGVDAAAATSSRRAAARRWLLDTTCCAAMAPVTHATWRWSSEERVSVGCHQLARAIGCARPPDQPPTRHAHIPAPHRRRERQPRPRHAQAPCIDALVRLQMRATSNASTPSPRKKLQLTHVRAPGRSSMLPGVGGSAGGGSSATTGPAQHTIALNATATTAGERSAMMQRSDTTKRSQLSVCQQQLASGGSGRLFDVYRRHTSEHTARSGLETNALAHVTTLTKAPEAGLAAVRFKGDFPLQTK